MALLGVPQRPRYTRHYGRVTASSYRATTGIATRKPYETSRRDGDEDVVVEEDDVQYLAYPLKPAGQWGMSISLRHAGPLSDLMGLTCSGLHVSLLPGDWLR